MSVTSEIVGNGGHTLTLEGKTFKMKLIDQTMKSDFEVHLYAADCSRLAKIKSQMPGPQYESRLGKLTDGFVAGEYSFFSERGVKYMQSADGMTFILSMIFSCSLDEVFALLSEQTAEVENLLRLCLQESFPGVRISFDKKNEPGMEGEAAPK